MRRSRRRNRNMRFHGPRTALALGVLVLLVALVLWAAWYASQRTTVLEVLAVLNPAGPTPAPGELTPTAAPAAAGLAPVALAVPDRFRTGAFAEPRTLYAPAGFRVSVYAAGVPAARFFALSPQGVPFLSLMREGRVVALPDRDRDGAADEVVTFAEGLNLPHGLAFRENHLYVAENSRVVRFRLNPDGTKAAVNPEVVVPNLPSGGGHVTRTLGFGPDGGLYVSVGSSCNLCRDDPRRAAILRFNADGTNESLFARGLRNAVGIVWHEGRLWATDNGRDFLGDDLPPEEVDLVRAGGDYGWPYCYGDRVPDPEYNDVLRCARTEPPAVKMQAHSAPLGLRFYTGVRFPADYRGDLFVAFHGSWNRRTPTGYKLVRIQGLDASPSVEDFLTGWLVGTQAWGRPVDVLVLDDGSMLVSDDHAGAVYRVSYAG